MTVSSGGLGDFIVIIKIISRYYPHHLCPSHQAELKAMKTSADGRSIILGMGDGSMTTLTIADPQNKETKNYLNNLPSRILRTQKGFVHPKENASKIIKISDISKTGILIRERFNCSSKIILEE